MKHAELAEMVKSPTATIGWCREYLRKVERLQKRRTCIAGHTKCALITGGPCSEEILARPGVERTPEQARKRKKRAIKRMKLGNDRDIKDIVREGIKQAMDETPEED